MIDIMTILNIAWLISGEYLMNIANPIIPNSLATVAAAIFTTNNPGDKPLNPGEYTNDGPWGFTMRPAHQSEDARPIRQVSPRGIRIQVLDESVVLTSSPTLAVNPRAEDV